MNASNHCSTLPQQVLVYQQRLQLPGVPHPQVAWLSCTHHRSAVQVCHCMEAGDTVALHELYNASNTKINGHITMNPRQINNNVLMLLISITQYSSLDQCKLESVHFRKGKSGPILQSCQSMYRYWVVQVPEKRRDDRLLY